MQESYQFSVGDIVYVPGFNNQQLEIIEVYDTFCVVMNCRTNQYYAADYKTILGLEYEDVPFNITP